MKHNLKFITLLLLLLVALLALAACGGGETAAVDAGNGEEASAAAGEELFTQTTIGASSAPGCVTCHSLEEGVMLVGPSLANVGARAGERVEGLSAEAYLRQSIVEPNAHVVEGFTEGVMYQNYGQDLTETQIANLVAFLQSLQ